MEPRGIDTDVSREMLEDFRRYGCILTPADGILESATAVNDSSVYDAVRRLILSQVRLLHRRQFVSYAVSGGKSILKFRRFAYGLHRDMLADAFTGMAPPLEPVESGRLVPGEVYVVRGAAGDRIEYAGRTIGVGQQFEAQAAHRQFQVVGAAEVRVWNGIRAKARPRGWSNRWVMSIQTQPYGLGAANIYKPDAYADHFQWHNPCLWQLLYGGNPEFKAHVNYGETVRIEEVPEGSGRWVKGLNPARVSISYISPEAPDAYNYAEGANFGTPSADFYRGCQIYRPPVEIESVTSDAAAGGQEIVTVTMTRRLDHHASAPASISEDPMSWSPSQVAALRAEEYRTPESALCEYARHMVDPTYQISRKLGDIAWSPYGANWPSGVFGSGYPRFIFTALIQEPWADDNDILDAYDTRAVVDQLLGVEVAIRAGCEGFLDQASTAALNNCRSGGSGCESDSKGLYDWVWENLIYRAAGNRYISPLPRWVREDNPAGHGPLPHTRMFADVFNALAAATDLLVSCRVMLPCRLEQKQTTMTGAADLAPEAVDVCGSATGVNYHFGSWYGKPPPATLAGSPTDADWVEVSFVSAVCGAGIGLDYPQWRVTSSITTAQWRFALVDPNAQYAIPEHWRDQVVEGSLGTMFCREVMRFEATNGHGGRPASCDGRFEYDETCGLELIVQDTADCFWGIAGTLDPGKPWSGWMFYGYDNAFPPLVCSGGPGQAIYLTPLSAEPPVFVQAHLL